MSDIDKMNTFDFVELYLSDDCPLKCSHCYHADVRSVRRALSLNNWQNVIDQCLELGIVQFHIAGREPFAEDVSMKVIDYLADRKLSVPLKFGAITNGLNCQKYLSVLSSKDLDYLEISVDGLESGHEYLRGKGTYQAVVNSIRKAVAVLGSDRINLSTTIIRSNLSQILLLIQNFYQMGVKKFFFQPLHPYGFAQNIKNEEIEEGEYEKLLDCAYNFLFTGSGRDLGVSLMFYIPPRMSFVLDKITWVKGRVDTLENQGIITLRTKKNYLQIDYKKRHIPYYNSFIVTHDGYLIDQFAYRSKQNYVDYSIGNVLDASLSEIIKRYKNLDTEVKYV